MDSLNNCIGAFRGKYPNREAKMNEFIEELRNTSEEHKTFESNTNSAKIAGGVATGIGLTLAIFAAPFTAGLSVLIGGLVVGTAGALGVAGSAGVSTVKYNDCCKRMQKITQEFKDDIRSIESDLQKILQYCKKIQNDSGKMTKLKDHTRGLLETTKSLLPLLEGNVLKNSESILKVCESALDKFKEFDMLCMKSGF